MAYSPPPEMDPAEHGPPSVINAALMRSGTLSMARAYAILGLRAHHGLDMPNQADRGAAEWAMLDRATDATWPHVAGARSPPPPRFTRADWDALFGRYDAVTDVGALFADQLVAAYPDARVVVVQRDFDRWWASYQAQVSDGLFTWWGAAGVWFIETTSGPLGAWVTRKSMLGAFDAADLAGVRRNARRAYDGYYARIRALVPPERRLEYRLGDGWEPLCAFLGKEVPDVPFPRVNDRENHRAWQMEQFRGLLLRAWGKVQVYVWGGVGAAAAAVALSRYLAR